MEKVIHEQRRSGLSYEVELELLAEVYRLALESYREKQEAERAETRHLQGGTDGE
jgi:hypothetical protein